MVRHTALVNAPLQLLPMGVDVGPFKHTAELMEGKKRENGVGGGGGRERVCS